MLLCSPLLAGETEAGELTWPKTSCPPCLSLPAREESSLLGQIHPGCHRELFRDSSARSHLYLMDASSVALAGFCFVFPQRPMAVSCNPSCKPWPQTLPRFSPQASSLHPILLPTSCTAQTRPQAWGPGMARKLPVPGWLRHSICAAICSLPAVYPLPSS